MQFGLANGTLESAEPLLCIGQMQWAGDDGEFGMPHLKQTFSCVVRPLFVVSGNAISAPVLRKAVDANHTGPGPSVRFSLGCQVTEIGWNHDEARGKVSPQLIQMDQLLGMVVVRIAQY